MGKPLTVHQINQTIQAMGYPALPHMPGPTFYPSRDFSEDVVVAHYPDEELPRVFYLKADDEGNVVAFKAM